MSEHDDAKSSEERPSENSAILFATFLESCPPGESRNISDLFEVERVGHQLNAATYRVGVSTPEIQLHCPHAKCNGPRSFRSHAADPSPVVSGSMKRFFSVYRCANCQHTLKTFSLNLRQSDRTNAHGTALKYGENPSYGPPTPTRLLRIFGNDREIFLKGRRCENQGLGVGAFSYYRRVVEGHKNQLLEEIRKVAEQTGAPREMIDTLQNAKSEIQFSKAMASVKDAIPQSLMINGQNPLTALHSALSIGLHEETDERCLELAHDVRVILAELTDRIGQALKDEAELNAAISRLMQPRAKKEKRSEEGQE